MSLSNQNVAPALLSFTEKCIFLFSANFKKFEPSFQDAEGNWYNDYSLVSFVLESEITAAGTYSLVIPANYINRTSDGSYFEGATLTFTIEGETGGGDTEVKYYRVKHVASGKYLHINERNADYSTGPIGSVIVSDFAEVSDQVFSIEENENGKYLVSSEGYYIVCRAWNVDAWNDAAMGSALTFEATENEGEFYIKCANGYFKVENVDGVDYPFCDAPITAAATWVLEEAEAPAPVEPVEFGVVSVDPADGSTVSSITTITVTFSHAVSCDALRPGIDTYNIFGDNGSVNEAHFSIEGNVVKFELISGIYDAGVYTLAIPKYIFTNAETGEVFEGAKFLFTVDGTLSGIGNVNAEDGNQVIYDLNGRRVKNAVKGVYIINGKKVLVK